MIAYCGCTSTVQATFKNRRFFSSFKLLSLGEGGYARAQRRVRLGLSNSLALKLSD